MHQARCRRITSGLSDRKGPRRPAVGVLLAALLAACSHRSIIQMGGAVPVPAGVRAVVFTMQNGLLTLVGDAGDSLRYEGLLKRSGDTQELLATVEQIPGVFTAERAPEHPDILIVTLPRVGDALLGHGFVAAEVVVHIRNLIFWARACFLQLNHFLRPSSSAIRDFSAPVSTKGEGAKTE
jgi:hypothetical protein